MRKVDRKLVKKPKILDEPYRNSGSEFERNLALLNQGVLPGDKKVKFKFGRYSHHHVKTTLETIFHGKCAYCESFYAGTQPVDVEHYRPKGQVAEDKDHGGYWWLAADWDNLVPSCIDCNRKRKQELPELTEDKLADIWGELSDKPLQMGKKDAFPLSPGSTRATFDEDAEIRRGQLDAEERLLLDPTQDDPQKHLTFNVGERDQFSLVLPWGPDGKTSAIGLASVRIYGLNRLRLVQARQRVLRNLQFLFQAIVQMENLKLKTEERVETKRDHLNGLAAGSTEKEVAEDDLAFLEDVLSTTERVSSDLVEKMVSMTRDDAPFSVLANTWMKKNIIKFL